MKPSFQVLDGMWSRLILVAAVSCTSVSGLTGGAADAGVDGPLDATRARLDASEAGAAHDGGDGGDGGGGAHDAGLGDGGSEASLGGDASEGGSDSDGAACPSRDGGYHDITSAACWTAADITFLDTFGDGSLNFQGAVFDGTFVYLIPSLATVFARYDTRQPLSASSAWTSFPAAFLQTTFAQNNLVNAGYAGGVFDGRYVYAVPSPGAVARYDTTASFVDPSSWASFNPFDFDAGQVPAYVGGTFDGRYVYFAGSSTSLMRFDTHGSFDSQSSWQFFSLVPSTSSFAGVLFDGRYAYFEPDADGKVARFDTTASFTDGAAWVVFDATTVDPSAESFTGGAFDGRFVYFAGVSRITAYDTRSPFSGAASWSTFDAQSLGPTAGSFVTGAFDGRFVYGVPDTFSTTNDFVVRADTTSPFATTTSWSSFSTDTLSMNANGFGGAVFDGKYMYLVPGSNGVVARFDARETSQMPALYGDAGPRFFGSFF